DYLSYTLVEPVYSGCSVTANPFHDPNNSTALVLKSIIDLNLRQGMTNTVSLVFAPSYLQEEIHRSCSSTLTVQTATWWQGFDCLHHDEGITVPEGQGYVITNLKPGGGSIYAQRTYSRSQSCFPTNTTVTENSVFELKHTPQS